MKKPVVLFLLMALILSCTKRETEAEDSGKVEGYRPVYMSPDKALTVSVEGVEPLEDAGKIYWYYNYMFLTDKGKGVHVIDISVPSNPAKVSFIRIPGVKDVAVKNNFLFADNLTDMVVFNITDVQNITHVERVKNVYPVDNQMYPAHVTGDFECVDTTKGMVVGWEKAMLEDPKCRR
ncbi:MAG: hypothetical protein K9H84_06375 [Bacteroidales bacterium]|nr:hypothetical protein [Bacteroidales bacterium]